MPISSIKKTDALRCLVLSEYHCLVFERKKKINCTEHAGSHCPIEKAAFK